MYIQSFSNSKILIKNDNPSYSIKDLLTYRGVVVGNVNNISLDLIEIELFTKNIELNIGHNNNLYLVDNNNNQFLLEYLDNQVGISGIIDENIDNIITKNYNYISILEEGCKVSTGDVIGYIKYKNCRYNILVPDGIFQGVITKPSVDTLNYYDPINVINYKNIDYPIYLNSTNAFNLKKINTTDYNGIVIKNRDIDAEILKVLSNYDLIIHFSSKLPKVKINSSIISLKEFFLRVGINNIVSVGFNDYPYFSDKYLELSINKAKTTIEQYLLKGFNILFFYEGIAKDKIKNIQNLEGDYRTKIGKNISLRIVELQ